MKSCVMHDGGGKYPAVCPGCYHELLARVYELEQKVKKLEDAPMEAEIARMGG